MIKQVLLLFTAVGLVACQGKRGHDGLSIQGPAGAVGPQGPAGTDGVNGTDGSDGQDASPTPYTPVALLNPCGDAPGLADEVFILLANGEVLASFSDQANGNNTRFAALAPGNYVTTDGDNCSFTLNSDGSLSNESKQY